MIDWNDNISDEMLAAYLDGNANMEECSLIQDQMANDSMLSEVIDIVNDINQLGLGMYNDNLIMNPMDTNMDWNNGTDIISTPLTIPEYNDDLSQIDSFNNGFDRDSFDNNDINNIFDNTLEE
ncbi:MAG: hypothetical protein UHE93_04545 [Muribaculaceae bacterium]|nr:hypothetical protein [Muribaculaceae bacterium]